MSTNTAITPIQATMTNGPSAADIVNSLYYAYSPRKLPVRFSTNFLRRADGGDVEFDAVITGVRYDVSGQYGMFFIEFYVTNHRGWGVCRGFYNANRRRGTFSFNTQ